MDKQILLCLWMINIQFVLQKYLCNLYRKPKQLLNGSWLQNAEIQSAVPDNCSCFSISPFQNGKIWNKICISLHYYKTSRQVPGIYTWKRNIFKIPSSCESKPQEPSELCSVVLVDVRDSKQKIIYKAEECLPLGKADNIKRTCIQLVANTAADK